MLSSPLISVIVPVYNNSETLEDLYLRISKHLLSYRKEIIFVNDASIDASQQVIDDLMREHKNVRGFSFEENKGQQKATLTGIRKAKGDFLIVMDADLQDRPELIVELLTIVEQEGGVCFVKRMGMYQSIPRMLTSRIFKKLISLITSLDPRAGSFYLMDKKTKEKLLTLNVKRPYLSIMTAIAATNIQYLEATRGNRPIGKSEFDFIKRLKASFWALDCAISCQRIKKKQQRQNALPFESDE